MLSVEEALGASTNRLLRELEYTRARWMESQAWVCVAYMRLLRGVIETRADWHLTHDAPQVAQELGEQLLPSQAVLELTVLYDLVSLVIEDAQLLVPRQLEPLNADERARLEGWVVAVHLEASDNRVRVPPQPLDVFDKRPAPLEPRDRAPA
jgi:hypothetical protein